MCKPFLTIDQQIELLEARLVKKQQARRGLRACSNCDGGQRGSRTPDTRIFSPLLYQLSYLTGAVSTTAC